jgi:hypothetical protein
MGSTRVRSFEKTLAKPVPSEGQQDTGFAQWYPEDCSTLATPVGA